MYSLLGKTQNSPNQELFRAIAAKNLVSWLPYSLTFTIHAVKSCACYSFFILKTLEFNPKVIKFMDT